MIKPILPRYILCQYIPLGNGKSNKIPLNPNTLYAHDPFDSIIHMTYESAKSLSDTLGDLYGIGYVFLKEDNYFFIDLDGCINSDGTLNQLAQNSLTYFPNAYIEISHSGKGLHIIGRFEGDSPFKGRRLDSLGIEIYTSGRFCALAEINPSGDAQSLHTERLYKFISALGIDITTDTIVFNEWTTEAVEGTNPPQDNLKLIEWFLNKSLTPPEALGNILSIRHLWENNIEVLAKHFPSQISDKEYDYSSADAALAYRLHYLVGGNCERVQELMNLSKLKRDKWKERPDYLPRTIIAARGRQKDYFIHVCPPQASEHNNSMNPYMQHELNTRLLQTMNYPELSARGKVLDTSTNLKMLLDIYNISVRWNNMSREREIKIPKCELFPEDAENYALSIIKDLSLINEMPIIRIEENLNLLAQQYPFHPIVERLKENPWDGISRLNEFINTIESSTPQISYKLIKRWMISAIAAAHSKTGFSSPGVLVLAGEQRIGKTQFIKNLDPFNCKSIKSGALLDPTNKDCIRTLAGFWIAELGELDASFRKSDIARIKSYITEDLDKIRFPHMRKDSILHRRTVFAATVNNSNFLVDETGNRRWWTIPVISIDLNHGLDITQVWSEVFELWKNGEQNWLTDNEFLELNELNTQHEQIDPLEELLFNFFDFSEGWKDKALMKYQATDVLRKIGYDKPNKSQSTRMGFLIKKNTGIPPNRRYHFLLPKI